MFLRVPTEDHCKVMESVERLNDAPFGALVGRIGEDGEPFFIGANHTFTPAESGVLYLAVNDYLGYYDDNSGSYWIFIQ